MTHYCPICKGPCNSYVHNDINVLTGVKAVRKRPRMYLGKDESGDILAARALMHVIWFGVNRNFHTIRLYVGDTVRISLMGITGKFEWKDLEELHAGVESGYDAILPVILALSKKLVVRANGTEKTYENGEFVIKENSKKSNCVDFVIDLDFELLCAEGIDWKEILLGVSGVNEMAWELESGCCLLGTVLNEREE